jgi:hypothetical protein
MSNSITITKALAPRGWTSERVIAYLRLDPYQSRLSQAPILLSHPRTGVTRVLKEYAEDIAGNSRFAIETEDSFVFISRVTNSSAGTIFGVTKVISKDELRRG